MQDKWDRRYQHSTDPGDCCWVLQEYQHLLPPHGTALDLACGLGANALFLAAQGLESHGWDISTTALAKLAGFANARQQLVHTEQRDIEASPPAANSFDVIVVSQFLYRPICPALVAALNPGGLLFYQTFNQQRQNPSGPSNSDYLLANNELLSLFSTLLIRAYREDGLTGDLGRGQRDLSYLVAQKPSS